MTSRKQQLEAFDRLLTIMDELRSKCPWDKKHGFLYIDSRVFNTHMCSFKDIHSSYRTPLLD